MKKMISMALALLFNISLMAGVDNGQTAPDFTLKGHDGKTYKLSEVMKEKGHIVLEWFNNECPYVEKHYGTGNMQALQKKYTEKGIKWYSIISSAEGKQGYRDMASATKTKQERGQASNATLLDPTGKVGKMYGAKTTPHMYVINPEGKIVYQGAIDDNSSYKKDSVKSANNYLVAALDASLAGKPVKEAKTKPYGCSVKY